MAHVLMSSKSCIDVSDRIIQRVSAWRVSIDWASLLDSFLTVGQMTITVSKLPDVSKKGQLGRSHVSSKLGNADGRSDVLDGVQN